MRSPPVHIIAGRWKRRRLEAPRGARPTSGKAREALFSILGERIAGANVLDLFAGSGAVGLEALSRGARGVVLVETDSEPLARAIERLAPEPGEARLLARDAASALASLEAEGARFDLVFADPPYAVPFEDPLSRRILPLLAPGGLFVLQRDSDEKVPAPEGLALLSRRGYGRNTFLFFEAAAFDPGSPRC